MILKKAVLKLAKCLPILAAVAMFFPQPVFAEKCEKVVQQLNQQLSSRLDERELVAILHALNASGNTSLPPKFITKKHAKKLGWRPGSDLWGAKQTQGKSIGGDFFGNYEGRLPKYIRNWREADLGYTGGHRGAKRLIFSREGLRYVTVDHYSTFREVLPCR